MPLCTVLASDLVSFTRHFAVLAPVHLHNLECAIPIVEACVLHVSKQETDHALQKWKESLTSTQYQMVCWECQGVTPTCLQHCQVSCLGKQKKEIHGCLAAESFRPVSVLSIFWRAWSATWINSIWVDRWRSQLFPANMVGGYPKAWAFWVRGVP